MPETQMTARSAATIDPNILRLMKTIGADETILRPVSEAAYNRACLLNTAVKLSNARLIRSLLASGDPIENQAILRGEVSDETTPQPLVTALQSKAPEIVRSVIRRMVLPKLPPIEELGELLSPRRMHDVPITMM